MLAQFSGLNGEKLWINPAHVMFVTNSEEENHGVLVMTNGLEVPVVPTPEETAKVLRKVMEESAKTKL